MPALQKAGRAAGTTTRVQGVTGSQTVKNAPAILHRAIIANADAAVQTLTIADDTTVKIVVRVPAGDTRAIELGIGLAASLKVTPSNANIDALLIYD